MDNGIVIGASAEYDRLCDLGDRLQAATESELAELLADDGSVESAIGANADVIRTLLVELTAHPERGADIARRMWAAVRSDLEPVAIRAAERSVMWGEA
jgi:hypothetical protein